MIHIVVDAMGGDHAPEQIVKGAAEAAQENNQLFLTLVGNKSDLVPLIQKYQLPPHRFQISHTPEFIAMNEAPREGLARKKKASIHLAMELVARGQGDAVVSAGNTGATILSASQHIPRLPGIERAALSAVFPAIKSHPDDPGKTVILDVGATLHCTPQHLISFAIMGKHYAREVLDIPHPRIGLLNIGEEESKGHEILIRTHRLLQKIPGIRFIGNIEGRDVLRGVADVIVTEGFVGNVVLKALEGVAELALEMGKKAWQKGIVNKIGLILLSPLLKKIKNRVDYQEYGGAPILGFEKLVIKAHGRSRAKAIKNAILLAYRSVENNMIGLIKQSFHTNQMENSKEVLLSV